MSSIKNGSSSAVKKSVQIAPTHENISKLPLNDTVEKEDPDRFANKIKEAIQRYDAEMGELHAAELAAKQEIAEQQRQQEPSQRKTTFEEVKVQQSPSPSSSPTNKSHSVNSNNNNNRSPASRSPDQQTTPQQQQQPKYNSKVVNIVSHEDDSSISDLGDETHVLKKSDSTLSKGDDKPFSFKPFATSPSVSPILAPKTASSPDQSNPKNSNNFSFSSSSKVVKQSSQPNSPVGRSSDNRSSPAGSLAEDDGGGASDKKAGQKDRSEKMLIEKDGDFLLLSQEEYLAMKEAEKAKPENKKPESKPKTVTVIPHPPQRPKTTNDRHMTRFRDQNNETPNQNNTRTGKTLLRPSHSADVSSRNRGRDSSKR